jgi:hypothetical protein
MLYDFCAEKKIPTQRCGKLIVAVDDSERGRLRDVYQRGKVGWRTEAVCVYEGGPRQGAWRGV